MGGDSKNNILFKTLIVIILFFTYTFIFNALFTILHIDNPSLTMFISDFIFLIGIIYAYKNTLKKDIQTSKIKEKAVTIFIGFIIVLLFSFLINGVLNLIYPEKLSDSNFSILSSLNPLYVVFKVLIFSTIAEELVFHKAIGQTIDNKVAFIFISTFIYTIANIIYWDLTLVSSWLNAINYFVIYLILSVIYVKCHNNIVPVMIIKLLYNLFPLIILLS